MPAGSRARSPRRCRCALRRRPVRPGGRPLWRPGGGRILRRRHVPPPRVDLRRAARAVPGLPLPQLRRRARAEAGKLRLPRQYHHRSSGDHRVRHQVPRRPGRCPQDRLLRRPAREPRVAEPAGGRQERARPVLQHRRFRGVRGRARRF
ncbi:hypothetical protein G6F50_015131 [Rhizopus delemar]|uniref:Uncharacterized protein n=1 Tax=Rhizopus delemar TaxID=936053 RepID=A0A9P7C551_9FUNG|nr:hypothetical protein G6F50_015131 [Rhizopus delemar]